MYTRQQDLRYKALEARHAKEIEQVDRAMALVPELDGDFKEWIENAITSKFHEKLDRQKKKQS